MESRFRSTYNSLGTLVPVTTAISVVAPSRDQSGLLTKSFWLLNGGPAALNAGSLECSPDGVNWLGYDGTTLQTLGSATLGRILVQNDSGAYWRFRASTGSSTATVSFWWNF